MWCKACFTSLSYNLSGEMSSMLYVMRKKNRGSVPLLRFCHAFFGQKVILSMSIINPAAMPTAYSTPTIFAFCRMSTSVSARIGPAGHPSMKTQRHRQQAGCGQVVKQYRRHEQAAVPDDGTQREGREEREGAACSADYLPPALRHRSRAPPARRRRGDPDPAGNPCPPGG